MSLIRTAIDNAVAEAIAEHPKYFTPRGLESAQGLIVRKVMAALRGDTTEKSSEPTADSTAPQFTLLAPTTSQARAYVNLRRIAGATAPTLIGNGQLAIPSIACNDAVAAFATLPPSETWCFLTGRCEIGAWKEFFRDMLPDLSRRSITRNINGETGILMPWPFPPSRSGKVYEREEAA